MKVYLDKRTVFVFSWPAFCNQSEVSVVFLVYIMDS